MQTLKRFCSNPDRNPNCKKELSYSTKYNKIRAEKLNTNCLSCSQKGGKRKSFTEEHKKNISKSLTGGKRSEETKRKMNESKKGIPRSEEVRKKISKSKMGDKNPAKNPEVRKKMRLSAIKRIEKNKFNGGQMTPGYNPKAIPIIDEYSKKHGFNFRHAENGGEQCIGGYFPDGLDEQRKTIIEIDESQHFNSDGTYREKDIQRQKYLEGLGYKFIRIKI